MSNGLFATLRELSAEISTEKKAAQRSKTAASNTEPGGYTGASTHPSADVEDHTEDGKEGSRSAENTKDIKDGRDAPRVDSIGEATPDTVKQEDHQLNIGITSKPTGEDPSVERDYDDRYKDPGDHENKQTESPAKSGEGEKFGAWQLPKLIGHCNQLGNELLAEIYVKQAANKQNGKPPAGTQQKTAGATQAASPANAADQAKQAAQQGYVYAAALGMPGLSEAQCVERFLGTTIKEAHDMADMVGACLNAYQAEQAKHVKQAEDMPGGADKPEKKDPAAPPDAGGGDSSPAGGGNGPPGGGGMPPGMDAGPPSGAAPGGDLGGGMPGGGGMGMDAGGGGGGAPMEQLAAAMIEMGIDPMELAAAAQKIYSGAGGAGGPPGGGMPPGGGGLPPGIMPPEAGGAPPMGGEPKMAKWARDMHKAASDVQQYRRSGSFTFREAKTAGELDLRNRMKQIVRETLRLAQ